METHKDLDIWQRGLDLVTDVYRLTKNLPKEEIYGLSSQMQRAAISFPGNIAEGAARNSKAEYVRFVYIAVGSLSELETQVMIVKRLGYAMSIENILETIEELRRKTLDFVKYLKTRINR